MNRSNILCFYLNNDKIIKKSFSRKIIEDIKEFLDYGTVSFNISKKETKTIYLKTNSALITPIILKHIEDIIREEKIYFALTNILIGLSLISSFNNCNLILKT